MNYSKSIISEVMKSTFLTIASFMLFDIFIQGYSAYHNWVLPLLTTLSAGYYFRQRQYTILCR